LWWHCIPYLDSYFDPLSLKYEVVREALQSCRLAVRNRPVSFWVKIAAFFRLVELATNRDSGPIPP